jgi:hypothetical protein
MARLSPRYLAYAKPMVFGDKREMRAPGLMQFGRVADSISVTH